MTAPIIGWARPLEYTASDRYHAVVAIDPRASVTTACSGRWSASEDRDYLDGRDREFDHIGRRIPKCLACDRVAREQRTRDGLHELASARVEQRNPAPWPMGLDDFDNGGES